MMGSGIRSALVTAAMTATLLASWYCLWPVLTEGIQLNSHAVDAMHNYVDLSAAVRNYEDGYYCAEAVAHVSFTVQELRSAFRGGHATGDFGSADRLFLTGQKLFNCMLQRATGVFSSTGSRKNGEPYTSSVPNQGIGDEFHAFTIKHVSLPGLEGLDELQFYCKGQEGPDVTVLNCAPRPHILLGSLILRLDFEVLARRMATRKPWCRITHNLIAAGVSSFMEAAVGLCTAFGYTAQLLRNEGFAVLDSIPDLIHLGMSALGFQPSPARYTQSNHPFFLAGVKPASDEPSPRETDRGAASFESRRIDGFESWYGIGVNRRYFDHALHNLSAAFQAAVMTDGRTTVDNDCIMRIATPSGNPHFREAGGGACRPNRPFLQCVRAIQREVTFDALSMLLNEVKGLVPDVQHSSGRMLHFLSEPRAWRTLHSLIGPETARVFESPAQRARYETGVRGGSAEMGDQEQVNLQASPEPLASELFRFAIWYVDIFPSQRYWESLKLGCVRMELAYVNAMGKIGTRQFSASPLSTMTRGQGKAAYVSMINMRSVAEGYSYRGVSSPRIQLADNDELTFEKETAITLPHGQIIKPLQSQYSFEEVRAISNLNPPERKSDGMLRKLWLSSRLFDQHGYLLITDVPARDGGFFDLKILCSKTGTFRHTRLTGWFSDYLCEPDYIELPQNDVAGIWRRDNMPVNRMIGIEFESHPPWRCGVSFLGDEHSLRETPVNGGHLLTIMTGLCSLMGFKTGWVLDSAKDLYTNELMKITMVLEKRVSFYESFGFLLSVDTLKSRHRAETCVGSSVSEPGPILVGVCHQPRDILINPGFEKRVLHALARKAYNTLYTLTFDCTSLLWKNCARLYPLSVIDHRGDGCAFERHPLYQELRYLSPSKCNVGKRVGDCHKFVRRTLKCDRSHKTGCKYLAFLYSTFLYPGGVVEEEIPEVMRNHFEEVSIDLFQESRRYISEGIRRAAAKGMDDLASGHGQNGAQEELPINEVGNALNTILVESSKRPGSRFTQDMRDMLLESVVFHDWTNTPQFWIRALYDYSSKSRLADNATNMFCPVGYAWAFITRVQGQLYRRPLQVAHTDLPAVETLEGVAGREL